jgi:hypothetical protein
MTVRRAAVASSIAALVFVVMTVAVAAADQQYRVDGRDTFVIGSREMRSDIAYKGTQTLHIQSVRGGHRYTATVTYQRNDQGAITRARGSYESTISASGDQADGANNDPDYLTILNQPFAVQLDAPTLHDLAHLGGSVPFDFPSPITGAPLHGQLRHAPDGIINGTHVLGVAFEASGPLHGSLPDHPEMSLSGTIVMKGTAYYTYADALLLGLDATLRIAGTVDGSRDYNSVEITYTRSIRATPAPAGPPNPHRVVEASPH